MSAHDVIALVLIVAANLSLLVIAVCAQFWIVTYTSRRWPWMNEPIWRIRSIRDRAADRTGKLPKEYYSGPLRRGKGERVVR